MKVEIIGPRTVYMEENTVGHLFLYETEIITVDYKTGEIKINVGEYPTNLTRKRINTFFEQLKQPYMVVQKQGKQMLINNKEKYERVFMKSITAKMV